jgi:hypothetical protein
MYDFETHDLLCRNLYITSEKNSRKQLMRLTTHDLIYDLLLRCVYVRDFVLRNVSLDSPFSYDVGKGDLQHWKFSRYHSDAILAHQSSEQDLG